MRHKFTGRHGGLPLRVGGILNHSELRLRGPNIQNTMSNEENTNIPRRRTDRITPQGKHTRLRNILNIIFMLGAVIGLIIYFYSDKTIGAYVILAAIGVKLVECSIRLIN